MTQNPDGHASKGDEKHERTVQRRVPWPRPCTNCGWAHSPPGMAAALLEPTPKGALALHLLAPWGKGGATWWFETDAGVLLEAKPVAPVETTRTPRVRVVATSGGEGFGKQQLLFAKTHRMMFFLSRTLKRLRVY